MGTVVRKLADYQVLTSDNPRFEDPWKILDDIAAGCPYPTAKIIERGKAIKFAYRKSQEKEVIIVAGKGHEDYQEIKGKKHFFNDRQYIMGLR